jgi:hypothetical protein
VCDEIEGDLHDTIAGPSSGIAHDHRNCGQTLVNSVHSMDTLLGAFSPFSFRLTRARMGIPLGRYLPNRLRFLADWCRYVRILGKQASPRGTLIGPWFQGSGQSWIRTSEVRDSGFTAPDRVHVDGQTTLTLIEGIPDLGLALAVAVDEWLVAHP